MAVRYLIVVVSERAAQFVIVHVVLVLAKPPQACDFLGIDQLELPVFTCPGDQVTLPLVLQEVEQELPQRDGGVHGWRTKEEDGQFSTLTSETIKLFKATPTLALKLPVLVNVV